MVGVSPIYTVTTIVYLYDDDKRLGNATGFFFNDKEKNLYLVTNKHIIYGEKYFDNTSPIINKIKLILHTDVQNLSKNEEIIIPLFKDEKKIWLEHKDKTIDVILIPLEFDRKKYVLLSTDESCIKSANLVISFEKIFIMGYPQAWYDYIHNLPVTRIGHLSSPFKVPFRGKPFMLGDVETHEGMSGGPVFMELEDYIKIQGNRLIKVVGKKRTLLIGIHSGQPIILDLTDAGLTNESNLDTKTKITKTLSHSLNYIWFSDLILEILNDPC